VDKNTLVANTENVYAIGDVTSVSIPGRWNPDKPMKLPKKIKKNYATIYIKNVI